jgi:hypothetical protein
LLDEITLRRQHLALTVDENYSRSPERSISRSFSENQPTITVRPRGAFFAPDCITP